MKKVFSLLVCFLLCFVCSFGVAFASSVDLKSLTDDELTALRTSIDAELSLRSPSLDSSPNIFVDDVGVFVEYTGMEMWGSFLRLNLNVSNESGKIITVGAKDVYVNGYQANSSGFGVMNLESGKKAVGKFDFSVKDFGIETTDQVETVELVVRVIGTQETNFEEYYKSDKISINGD